ncbi:MAG TPA: FAD-binding oxidoreductase [Fibrobacteria bacterium]|jgi:FAD/FMN-containing dehydrogenase|nr:FAD-binding oxidoreductase [Fibrobacteria bacterium]
MSPDGGPREGFEAKKAALRERIAAAGGRFHLRKRTASNLFRYAPRKRSGVPVDLGAFREVISLDAATRTLDVEGLATFESIVDYTLPRGFAPLVTPELKHITLGGASVGIGIESNCHKHGFVHDMLLEAEVLLPDGRIVVATADNEFSDLFRALGNSYGTLGYILRAKIRLMPAKPLVRLRTTEYADTAAFLDATRVASEDPSIDFVETLMYAGEKGALPRLLLITSRYEDAATPGPVPTDIVRRQVFYKRASLPGEMRLKAKDYLFRYDPEWFWNIPESLPYRLLRRFAPLSMRHSGFYKRWLHWQERMGIEQKDGKELLIQDWEVPWDKAQELLDFALREVDLDGKPWLSIELRVESSPTFYPIRPGILYFNLGCYCRVRKSGAGDFHATRLLDRKCLDLGGIKMLYSSSFMDEAEFDRVYNGQAQRALKAKYDPEGRFPTLYQKCVRGR